MWSACLSRRATEKPCEGRLYSSSTAFQRNRLVYRGSQNAQRSSGGILEGRRQKECGRKMGTWSSQFRFHGSGCKEDGSSAGIVFVSKASFCMRRRSCVMDGWWPGVTPDGRECTGRVSARSRTRGWPAVVAAELASGGVMTGRSNMSPQPRQDLQRGYGC